MGWRRTSSSTSHLLNGRLCVLTVTQPGEEEEEKKNGPSYLQNSSQKRFQPGFVLRYQLEALKL